MSGIKVMNSDNSTKNGFGLYSGVGSSVTKNAAPPKNWIHSDDKMLDGVIYTVKVSFAL